MWQSAGSKNVEDVSGGAVVSVQPWTAPITAKNAFMNKHRDRLRHSTAHTGHYVHSMAISEKISFLQVTSEKLLCYQVHVFLD